MNTSFIQEVAQRLLREHPHDMDKVLVVFNNRRPSLFLRRELAKADIPAFFLPNVVGMDELITMLGGAQIIPNEFILFELYDIHRNMPTNEGTAHYETFEKFMPLADMMLSDFSEIDLYCADAQQLFANLHNIKSIEEWDVEGTQLTPFQREYLLFYKSLYTYYSQLRQRLATKGQAYGGMAYRAVAEKKEKMTDGFGYKAVYFVGFNALSTSETTIVKTFIRSGLGHYIADGDAYYFDDPLQEAGHFLRRMRSAGIPDIGPFEDHFAIGKKEITIVECPEDIMQTKYAGQLLQQWAQSDPNTMSQTALVLADEKLLVPALNSLPQEIKKANVSMGFPFEQSLIHSLALKTTSLYANCHNGTFYHADILNILTDPLVTSMLASQDHHEELYELFARQHLIRANADTIEDFCQFAGFDAGAIRFLFSIEQPTVATLLKSLRQLYDSIIDSNILRDNPQEDESMTCFVEILDYFDSLQKEYAFIDSAASFQKIYLRIARRRSISFYGSPLKELQILGMLETRNLDFSRIILLSANEGVLPSKRNDSTLIPLSIKRHFNLPTYKEKEAIYANHFYRLIQQAEKIVLVYNSASEGMGKGEASRFILQIEDELMQKHPANIKINHESVFAPTSLITREKSNTMQKTGQLWERLIEKATGKGLYPSAINTYRACPMRYCYESLLSLRETDNLSDDMDQSDFGNLVHKALYEIFQPFAGRAVDPAVLRKHREEAKTLIEKAGAELFSHGRTHEGRNHFYESIATTLLEKTLTKEIELIESEHHTIEIIDCEKKIETTLGITVAETDTAAAENHYDIHIQGIADRIDRFDGTVRIVDYKTGKVDPKELVVSSQDIAEGNVSDKWFQVMLYAWVYNRSHKDDTQVLSGLYPLRNLSEDFLYMHIDHSMIINSQQFAAFEESLSGILRELMDPSIPFKCTPSADACRFCTMKECCCEAKK